MVNLLFLNTVDGAVLLQQMLWAGCSKGCAEAVKGALKQQNSCCIQAVNELLWQLTLHIAQYCRWSFSSIALLLVLRVMVYSVLRATLMWLPISAAS